MNWAFIWLAVILVAAILEAVSMELLSVWFVIGALGALIAAACGGPVWLQVILFCLISFVTVIFTRPIVLKYLKPKRIRTNADAIPGKTGVVTQAVHPLEGVGQVKIEGSIWSAKPEDGTSDFEIGESVEVVRIEGVKVVIRAVTVPEDKEQREEKEP